MEIDQPVLPDPCQVACLIEPLTGICAAGVRQKDDVCLLRLFPITRTETNAANIEIPYLPCCDRTQALVENKQLFPVARSPNRDRSLFVFRTGWNGIVAARYSRLRGTVKIGEGRMRKALHPVDQSRGRKDL